MLKTDLTYLPKFFDRYIDLVPENDLQEALLIHSPVKLFHKIIELEKKGDFMYAPGKWTIKQVIQHCIDTEQIMAYRAMSISRGETSNLPGFDENAFANNIAVSSQSIKDLIGEFENLRSFNISMFSKIGEKEILLDGKASGNLITPLALGFVIVGHGVHHNNIINEKYLNTLSN